MSGCTGAVNWISKLPIATHAGDATPALSDSLAFITGSVWKTIGGALHERSLWQGAKMIVSAFVSEPWIDFQVMYERQYLFAVDLRSGRLRWQQLSGTGRRVMRNQAGTPLLLPIWRLSHHRWDALSPRLRRQQAHSGGKVNCRHGTAV